MLLSSRNNLEAQDRDLMKFALSTLSASEEPSALVCPREIFIVTRQNLKQLSVSQLQKNVLNDIDAFCTSFGRNLAEEDFKESYDIYPTQDQMARLSIDFKAT